MTCPKPKTIFCDIDGTLIKHFGDIFDNIINEPIILNNVIDSIKEWDRNNYKIILTTGRKEGHRQRTEEQLAILGIPYDQLVMGITNGDRILINDKKLNSTRDTAYAVNVIRNDGLTNIDLINPLLYKKERIDKPWGYEELIEFNNNYVVKKLFMKKGNSCSIQYHKLKRETIVILKGTLNIYIGSTLDNLEVREYKETDCITIEPYTIHRMEALNEDCLYLETSTNQLWDIVRLQDNYGRV